MSLIFNSNISLQFLGSSQLVFFKMANIITWFEILVCFLVQVMLLFDVCNSRTYIYIYILAQTHAHIRTHIYHRHFVGIWGESSGIRGHTFGMYINIHCFGWFV